MVTTERITIAFRGDKHWAEWHRVQREWPKVFKQWKPWTISLRQWMRSWEEDDAAGRCYRA
jgi:hypothetical protein